MTVVNALVYHRGETILIRGWDLPGDRQHRRHAGVPGGRRRHRDADRRGDHGLRRLLGLRRPRPVLRALRPIARRSALTAALVSRLVPVAAADLAACARHAALRGPAAAPVGRAAVSRAASSRARWTARSTSRRPWSCEAIRWRAAPSRSREPARRRRGAPRLHDRPGGARRGHGPGGRRRRLRRGARASRWTPGLRRSPCASCCRRWLCCRSRRRCSVTVRPGLRVGPVADSVLSCEGLALQLSGGRGCRGARAGSSLEIEPRRDGRPVGPSGSGKTTLLRAASGLVPHFHGGEVERASSRSRAWTCASTDPPSWRRSSGSSPRSPRPRSSARPCGAEVELPLELRGRRRRGSAGPGGRGGRPGPRASPTCSSAPRTPSRAASCSAWRSPPRSSRGRGSFCSTSPPRSSTRSRGMS